jgi:TolB protein
LIYERPADGFAIGLPVSWRPINGDPDDLAAAIRELNSSNPGHEDMLSAQLASQTGETTKFSAFDFGPGAVANYSIANVNIIKDQFTSPISLDLLVEFTVPQLEKQPFVIKPVRHKRVQLQAGAAEEFRYQVKFTLPSGQTAQLAITQYLFVDGLDYYVVTLGAPLDRAAAYLPIFREIGHSFRLSKFAGLTGRITFDSQRHGQGNGEIYLMNADGSAQTRLTTNTSDDFHGTLSPDGALVAFVSNRDGNYEIYVMQPDGTRVKRLTDDPGQDVNPAWSPDGKHVAFTSDRDGTFEIYVMKADGSDQTRLTRNGSDDLIPKWSLDGSRIIFFSDLEGNYDIYSMKSDGSDKVQVTTDAADEVDPAWSPDGKKIVYTYSRDDNEEIYVMNADGTGQTRLTDYPASDRTPAWLPNGQWIVFVTNRDGNDEIYIMRADGSVQTRLTDDEGADLFPATSP